LFGWKINYRLSVIIEIPCED